MGRSRSKFSEEAVARRHSIVRNVLLGLLLGLAVLFVILAGRFVYGKSKDPNYRLADLFGFTTAGQPVLPALPTLPLDSIANLLPPAGSSETEPKSTAESQDISTESSTDEETSEEGSAELTTEPEADTSESESGSETEAEETTTPVETTKQTEGSTEEQTDGSTEETTAEPTTEETTAEETETDPVIAADPSDLSYHLLRGSLGEDELGSCTQLIVAQSLGTQCTLYFFEKSDDAWALSEAIPTAPGILGRNGVSRTKREGDGCTPAGFYAIGPCYGEEASSLTAMEYHQILEGDIWVDDPASLYYNQMVRSGDSQIYPDWRSGEDLYALMRYYKYMAVIRYNMDPIVPDAGSAIFLHCDAGDATTSGCVATKEATMFAILHWLSPEADPHILIY